jgi:hypothetical protein
MSISIPNGGKLVNPALCGKEREETLRHVYESKKVLPFETRTASSAEMSPAFSSRPLKYCFCILGWHFYEDFYEKIYQLPGDKYIICHREKDYFADCNHLFEKIKANLYFCENRGLEWGGYHQFNEMNLYQNYDFVIYCHDDLVIKDFGVAQAIAEKFQEPKLKVIGNGKNGTDWEFRFGKYKDRMFFQDEDDFVVRTVRGSFFAARTEIFSVIENFPVYWHTKKMKNGNLSLRNFGYLVTKNFGIDSIDYLDRDNCLETRYLIELRRGK